MRQDIKFIFLLIKLKLSHLMVFRLSFFGGFLADAMLFIVQLATFELIYGRVETIGGWTRGQMIIFTGTFSFINALAMMLFFFGINDIPAKIRTGQLDLYLVKPVSPLLRLTFENVDEGSVFLLLVSGGIVGYGIQVSKVTVTAGMVILYILSLLLMSVLYYDLSLIIRALPFFFITADTVQRLEGSLLDLSFRVPGVLYKGTFKLIFCLLLPYGLMATLPTQALSRTLSHRSFIYAVAVTAVFTLLAAVFWRVGLRRYKSASS